MIMEMFMRIYLMEIVCVAPTVVGMPVASVSHLKITST